MLYSLDVLMFYSTILVKISLWLNPLQTYTPSAQYGWKKKNILTNLTLNSWPQHSKAPSCHLEIIHYFPVAAILPLSWTFTPSPLSTNLHHFHPTLTLSWALWFPNSLRIWQQSEENFHKLLLPNQSTYLMGGSEIYFEDVISKIWIWIWCEVWGRERNQGWLLSIC